MKKILIALLLAGMASTPTLAQPPEDDLLEKLEASGKLDAAIDRAFERRATRERQQREEAVRAQKAEQEEAARKIRPLDATDRIYGPEHARVSIIVMSDLECPYCQRFAGVPEKAVDQSNGQANAAIRLFPLDFHGQPAIDASITALCVADQAGAKGYYAYFNGYLAASQGNGRGIPDSKAKPAKTVMDKLLKSAGVQDLTKLKTCQQDKATMKRLETEFNSSVEAGATGTPYVVLRNNENSEVKILPGAIPVEMLLDEVNKLANAVK